MKNSIHEGVIGIPQKPSGVKRIHYVVIASDTKSKRGHINRGHIVFIELKINNEIILSYDRGWIIKPDKNDHDLMAAYCVCLQCYN